MVTRRKTTATAVSAVSLLLLLLAGLATHDTVVDGAFHDGIAGSSLRFNNHLGGGQQQQQQQQQQRPRWSKSDHNEQQSRNLQSATGSTSAKETCEAAKAKEEADIAPGGGTSKCICEESVLDDRYKEFLDLNDVPVVFELTCVDERCSYCSPSGETCDQFSYGALFEEITVREGTLIQDIVSQVGYFETNQYIVGRPEAVVYTEYTDPNMPGSHACSMEIDGLGCAVCEYINCVGDETTISDENGGNGNEINIFYGLNVVCSNILIGDGAGGYIAANDFETCDQDQIDGLGDSQGVFEMYDPDYGQCYTAVEGCDRDKIELEQNNYYACDCLQGNLSTDGVSPFLENVQLQCEKTADDQSEFCGNLQKDAITRTYSSYVTETSTRSIMLMSGSTVTIEEFACQTTAGASDGCSECRASIDGQECSSCDMEVCERKGTGTTAPKISCGNASENIEDSKIIDLCVPESSSGTPFDAFAQCSYGEASRVPIVDAPQVSNIAVDTIPSPTAAPKPPTPVSLMACREKQNEFLQRINYIDQEVMTCECYLINEDGDSDEGTLLECTTNGGGCGTINGGSVCNARYGDERESGNGACFREELVQGFLGDGNKTPLTRTTTYTHGTALGNSLIGRTLVLTEYGNGNEGCQLLVDGDACNSCQLQNCVEDGIGIRPIVDCSNIVDDPSFRLDTCQAFSSYEDGLLLRLTAGASSDQTNLDSDFRVCSEEFASLPSNNAFEKVNFPVDPSLPSACTKAQPIVLPTQQDNPISATRDITNPNSNVGLVSFVSSTKGLSLPETNTEPESCAGEGVDSPGLWYSLVGSGKGIHASVCRDVTDFEARISIYEGSCADNTDGTSLSCVAGTSPLDDVDSDGSPCNVHWIAEAGKSYYLRVHGSTSSQTGTFNLFLETLADDVTKSCSDENNDLDQACLSCEKSLTTRVQQRSDPNEVNCQCIENPGTGGYHLTCVDTSCLKCNPGQDTCGFGTYELEIKRKGDTPLGSYESFYFMNKAEGTQASEISSIQTTECLEIRDPYQQCMMALEETMAADDTMILCECRGTSEEGDYMLLCSIYDSYEYCASDGSSSERDDDGVVCASSILFGQSISQYGSVTKDFRKYDLQTEGSEKSSIVVERRESECFVSINEEACSKCEIVQSCVNNSQSDDILNIATAVGSDMTVFTDLSVDCSNLLEGEGATATFECGSVGEGSDNNLLSILAGSVSPPTETALMLDQDSNNYNTIVDESDPQTIPPEAFPPTMPPITKPTPPPIEPVAPSMAPAPSSVVNTIPLATSPPASNTFVLDNGNATDNTNAPESTDETVPEGEEDSSAGRLAENRSIAYVASTMAFAFVFLFI